MKSQGERSQTSHTTLAHTSLILDSSEGETLFGGLFDAQGGEQENTATENDAQSWRNEGKMAVAESVGCLLTYM
jgi:hypothetical protein